MKRKVSAILIISALLLWLLPVGIGTAAEGDVKLVTPAELASPSGNSGTTFARLADVDYVSTVVDPSDMEATFGTLYVAIDDNDSDANVYEDVTETSTLGTLTGATTDITTAKPIVDRDRSGQLNNNDIVLVVNDVLQFTGILSIDPTGSIKVQNVILADSAEVEITYATSVQDSLIDRDGDSRVSVSSGQDRILVVASEANIGGIDANDDGGVDASDAAATDAQSTDSGVFLSAFGLIANDWKEALDTWADQTIVQDDDVEDAIDDRVNGEGPIGRVVVDEDHQSDLTNTISLTYTFNLDVQSQDAGGTNLDVGLLVSDRNGDGVVDERDLTVTYVDNSGGDDALTIASVAISGVSVTVNLKQATASGAEVADNNADTLTVSYETTSHVSDLLDVIEDDGNPASGVLVYSVPRDQALAFHDLERTLKSDGTDDTKEADDLIIFLRLQFLALYGSALDTTVPATAFINRLLGVEDGSEVEVSYRDPGAGTQRVAATADLVAPTVTITDPANGSFTPEDNFDGRFSVTDDGAGIPEDAETEDIFGTTGFLTLAMTLEDEDGNSVSNSGTSVAADEEDEVQDGFEYDLEIDVRDAARDQEDEDENLVVTITITAYDIAGNKSARTTTFTVDVTDPLLLGALTGWGVMLDDDVDQTEAGDENGAYVLIENQNDWIVLIFDGPINGDALEDNDVNIAGSSVQDVVWLDNTGRERISIGFEDDIDFDDGVTTNSGTQVADDVTDDNGDGLNLSFNVLGQDARHLLFVRINADDPFATDADPRVNIDGDDLRDLGGNTADDDHDVNAEDRIWPVFTVEVSPKLSNDALNVTISSSEDLDRRPVVALTLGDDSQRLTVVDAGDNSWTADTDIDSLNLHDEGDDDGVYTIVVTGEDENNNDGRSSSQKWELDTVANGDVAPERTGFAVDDKIEIEADEVIFVSFEFPGEADEYAAGRGEDSEKGIAVTGLSLETLDPDDEKVVTGTTPVALSAAQTSNDVKYVVALNQVVQGDYNLVIEYADVVGNTAEYKFRFDVIAQQPKTIAIQPGWNLISVPGIPQDSSITSVLTGTSVTQVWSFNNETKIWEFARTAADGSWEGTLLQISDGRAYFVRSSTFDPAKVLLTRFTPQRTPPQYNVQAGWNGIGYTPGGGETSITVGSYLAPLGNSWAVVRWWNPVGLRYESAWPTGDTTAGFAQDSDDVAIVEAGKGYMLYTTSDGTLAG